MDVAEKTLAELKEKGIRLTPQRQAILEYLKGVTTHPNAEEVYMDIRGKFPGISLGTIYNTLNMLRDKGLIQELSYGDMSSRFDGNPEPHYHLTCERCGKVVDYHRPMLAGLEADAARDTGFVITGHRLELYGTCADCQHSH
ncbi:MAG TPA: transcriptional repressor [Verrucomicrobiae bacterium]|nr:transcriptional repressor [Verrucomicrobiae bacterium]